MDLDTSQREQRPAHNPPLERSLIRSTVILQWMDSVPHPRGIGHPRGITTFLGCLGCDGSMAAPTRPPLRLLIVDDDDSLRQTLVRRFEREGMAITAAASAEEALTKAEQARCDVALLDLHLPGMTGI